MKSKKTNVSYSLVVCAIYYWFWISILPRFGGYRIRQEVLEVDANGASAHRLIKIPNSELAAWDREHDVTGRLRFRRQDSSENEVVQEKVVEEAKTV